MGAEVGVATLIYYAITIIIVAAGSYAAYKAASGAGDEQQARLDVDKGIRFNTRSTTEPVKVVYGKARIGGNDVYYYLEGVNSEVIWVVQTLCEGPIDSILIGDDGYDEVYLGNAKAYTYSASNLLYWLKTGTGDQVYDASLNEVSPEYVENMRYTAHIIWKLTWAHDVFQGLPKRQIVVKGRLLYDMRDDSIAWSDNIALAVWDWLVNGRYGMGINAGKLDVSSFISAANYCDAKGWTINLAISKADRKRDVLNTMLALMRGILQWYNGKFYLRYADLNYESTVMTIKDEHILRRSSEKAAVSISQPSRLQKAVGLNVLFTDPDKEYTIDGIIIGNTLGKVDDYQLTGCQNKQQVADLGYYMLERQQLDRGLSLSVRDDCLKLEPHDLVALDITSMSLREDYMRVVESSIRQDGFIDLILQYETSLLYDDKYNLDLENIYKVTLPDPTAEPPPIVNVSIEEEVYSFRMRSESRFNISFSRPEYAWYSHVEVWQSFDNVNWIFLFNVVDDFMVGPLEEGQIYYFRMKVVSIRGVKQKDNNDWKISKLATGQSSARPPSLTSLHFILSRNNGLSLFSEKIFDNDIEVYEFRLGSSWSGGVFLASLRSPNLVFNMVKPGVHVIFCNTLGTNGLYGVSPVSVQVTLPDPPDDYTIISTRLFNNLVTNGDMELDSDWANAGTPTVNERSSQQIHGENFSRKFTVDAQFEGIRSAFFTTISGRKYSAGLYVFPQDTTTVGVQTFSGVDGSTIYTQLFTGLTQNKWNEISVNWTEGGVGGGAWAFIVIHSPTGQTTGTWFVDDVCVLEGDFTNNMRPVLYAGDAYIKCSHTGGVFTGQWLSPMIDLGASDTYLLYSLSDIAIVGQGTMWSNQLPSPVKWNEVGVTTKKWREIFELSAAPKVEMSLDYGPDESLVNNLSRLEILGGIVSGRYYRLKIDIEDPQSQVFAYVEGPNLKFTQ
jgi:hypothetical protein